MATQMGNEKRTSILPTQDTSSLDSEPPDYSFADELPFPDQVGVRRGGSLNDVASAVSGIAFYADMIGFGSPSSGMTANLPIKPYPMGVNYFTKTPTKCSNGADMWVYINGIPKGDAFGKKVAESLRRLNMPNLQGLAPGILEDAKEGLNPLPIANAVMGTGYAKCKQIEMPVGDHFGRLKNVDGKEMVRPLFPGDILVRGGRPYQKRFVFDKWLTKDEWDKENQSASYCPDGSLLANHDENDCKKPVTKLEGFQSVGAAATAAAAEGSLHVPVVLVVALVAALWLRYKN
jgi:hypothetical protein